MAFHMRNIAITGGNGILGRAVAQAALAAGYSVHLFDVQCGDDIRTELASSDLLTLHKIKLLGAADTLNRFEQAGPIDALCNIAGGFTMGTAVHETPHDVRSRCWI
jgi:NAD(P)-dependent dehydrogenase (short-subunit alcohol dehydrogenase family)